MESASLFWVTPKASMKSCERGVTADTAIRLARYFGTSEEFWMNLQSNYELRLRRRTLRDEIAAITPLRVV